MNRILKALLVAAAVGGASVALVSCAGMGEKRVDHTASTVTVAVGETLVVDFGMINPSVGDEWKLVTAPDPAVLGEGESDFTSDGPDPAPGSPGQLVYRFSALAEGTTVISFEYLFRGSMPEELDEQETATITVTVD